MPSGSTWEWISPYSRYRFSGESGVDIKPELQIKQSQKLIMTPQLQQAIKMLQLSNLDLNQRIEEELVENPALEKEERQEYSLDEVNEEVIQQKIDKVQDEKVKEDVSRDETMKEYLLRQEQLLEIEEPDFDLAELLISYIDENGYLSVDLEEISGEFNIPVERLERVLRTIQSLDPPGVGARNIQECLIIQLKIKGDYPIAERIIRDFLNELRLKRYNEIAKKCRITKSKLDENLSIISHLEPYPGRQYYSGDIRYIIPDVIVEERDGVFEVISNSFSIPKLRVNRYFEDLMRTRSVEKRVKDFVSEKVQRAKTFMHSIDQRESTLVRVTRAIVDRQLDFFQRGPMYMKPMTLHDIAQDVDLHESTISRITSSKYVQTSFGVYSLKYFFSNPIPTERSGGISSTSIKEIIREIIDNEGDKRHLSDQKIVDLLQKRGIKIARRTVAKYRKELHILPSNLRRSQ
jgi:RNA polymerase sigma-54 factor